MFFNHENPSLHNNVKYARHGIEAISQEFPYGGLNREDTKASLQEKIYEMQIVCLFAYRKGFDKFTEGKGLASDLEIMIDAFQILKGAFCEELSHLTKIEIMKKFPGANVEVVTLEGGNHAMLVVGRHKDSDPLNFKTWGNDAIFCDPWAKKIYPTSDFIAARDHGKDIKHYKFIGRELQAVDHHYLAGEPKVLAANQYFPEDILSPRKR